MSVPKFSAVMFDQHFPAGSNVNSPWNCSESHWGSLFCDFSAAEIVAKVVANSNIVDDLFIFMNRAENKQYPTSSDSNFAIMLWFNNANNW
jgi:hypothetical protein